MKTKLLALIGVLSLAVMPALGLVGDNPASAAEQFVGPNITYVGFIPSQMDQFFADGATTTAAFWLCLSQSNGQLYTIRFSDCYALLTWAAPYSYPLMHWWSYFNYDLVFAWSIPGNYFLGNEPEGPV